MLERIRRVRFSERRAWRWSLLATFVDSLLAILTIVWSFRLIHIRAGISRKHAGIGNCEGIILLFPFQCISLLSMCKEPGSEIFACSSCLADSAARAFTRVVCGLF